MLNRQEVLQILPHSGNMALIDQVLDYDDHSILTEVRASSISVLAVEQGLPAYVGIELMAQSIAAWSGLMRKAKSLPTQVGFLLGTRKYECSMPYFNLESILRIRATEVVNSDGLAMFDCELSVSSNENAYQKGDSELAAQSKISVYSEPETE